MKTLTLMILTLMSLSVGAEAIKTTADGKIALNPDDYVESFEPSEICLDKGRKPQALPGATANTKGQNSEGSVIN